MQNPDPIGRRLGGRYEPRRPIGAEMLGEVYEGVDHESGRAVDIKVLVKDETGDDERFQRFGREITASFMVAHPNTVEVLDWGQDGDLRWLVLEPVRGETLDATLAKGPVPYDRVALIAAQIAAAIGAAHQEGIVHRALCPENVWLVAGSDDFVKVRDFGMSKLEHTASEMTFHTAGGQRVGHEPYMAPEYIETSEFHIKGDLYSLGALMFHLLTGMPPFVGSDADVLLAHLSTAPPAPSSLVREVPAWLDQLVLELLAKKPEERPGAYKVVQRLEAAMGRSLSAPKPAAAGAPAAPSAPSGQPTAYLAAAVVALLVVLLVAVAAVAVLLLVVVLTTLG